MAILRGVLVSFDGGTFTATIRIDGATQDTLTGVRCNRLTDSEFSPGRRVIIDTGDHWDATDAVITTVYT